MQVMLISILINIHYFQNIVSSFQENSNGQNHSLSDSYQPRFPTLLLEGFSPVNNTGDGSIYIPPKLQRVEIFYSESTSYLNLQWKTIPQVKEKPVRSVLPAFLQVGRG